MTAQQPYLSSFVEACFGTNTLLGVYSDLRTRWILRIETHNRGVIAKLKTWEVTGPTDPLTTLIEKVEKIKESHSAWQESFCNFARNTAIATAIICLFVLFTNSFAYWNALLILPCPAFFLVSYTASRLCRRKIDHRVNTDQTLFIEYKIILPTNSVQEMINEAKTATQPGTTKLPVTKISRPTENGRSKAPKSNKGSGPKAASGQDAGPTKL